MWKISTKFALGCLLPLLLVGCSGKVESDTSDDASATVECVWIYLYDDFPMQKAKMIEQQLLKYFPSVEISGEHLPLPTEAFVPGRKRYRGTGLLDDLKSRRESCTALGMTTKIICTKNELSPDFGIMGLSYLNRRVAVVSTTIPKTGTTQTDENLVKLVLHELGHAYGLPHCPDQNCYMVDAEHRMKFPQTKGFCKSCEDILKSKGIFKRK